jgi:hypothetical protein
VLPVLAAGAGSVQDGGGLDLDEQIGPPQRLDADDREGWHRRAEAVGLLGARDALPEGLLRSGAQPTT